MKRIVYFAFTLLLILFGVISAYRMRWMADDAFISLRYAKNFADGKGLVFNEGEFVEGYTNFLWTALLIPFHLFDRIDPVDANYFFGILSFLGTCIYLILFRKKFAKTEFPVPFALSCFVLLHHNRVFATGGLETSLHGFIFLTASYHLIDFKAADFDPVKRKFSDWFSTDRSANFREHYKPFAGVFLSSLSCLNRPDGILFHILAGIYLTLKFFQEAKSCGARSTFFKTSFGILCAIYLSPALFYIWKLEYYGNLLPNTFYAKSGGSSNLFQGLIYLFSFLKMYYGMIPIVGCFFFFFFQTIRKQFFEAQQEKDFRWILFVLFPIFYAGYYTWIGGDFMFSRFYLPILPVVFVWVEQEILSLRKKSVPKRTWVADALLYSIPILILLRWDIYKGLPFPIVSGIADENQIYKRESVEGIRKRILPWKEHFEKSKVRVAFQGSECILIYYLNPILAIETEAGLTDPVIARMEFKNRERIGHGKPTQLQYLRERNVHLLLYSSGLPGPKEYDEFLTGDFSTPWRILTYSPSVMKELLKISAFRAVDFESYLDAYKYKYKKLDPTFRKEKFLEFESYYFRNGEDEIRREWYRKNL
ncbi:hypothetical protein [Leptospira alstonii]|uniref:Membrane protein, PF09852 family n=2 Tax=Leptospira alstonii TaxID=28452 RepID=M6D4H2_9LEPT|nr:hypothetical protein [Leptospira alstonii]EMJ96128.1 hypothetical protein LEP1GSC194_0566 [Leptospira alstonii serovar Sichuan str. 79601]EQA79778.1 hypothetical protein LEP1GSC193_2031 [Leptospira alstonii serovar Pingchang str. 80-412]